MKSHAVLGLFALAAVLLAAPTLWMGFSQDDHIFRMAFRGAPGLDEMRTAPWNAYCFSDGDPQRIDALMQRGVFPWWTAPAWRVNFFRPIAALSVYCDYLLFGDNPLFMHLHNIAALALLVICVGVLYLRVMPGERRAAYWAALFYAMCGGHGIPVAWISHRNSLYAVLFATLSLLLHIEWRRASHGARSARAWWYCGASLALYGMALLSAELAFGFLGYFAAYALFLEPESGAPFPRNAAALVRRLLPLTGVAVVVGIWLALYLATGHGAKGSWFYIDPSKNPLHFFRETSERYPVLLFGLLTGVDSLVYALWPPEGQWVHLGVAIASIGFVGWTLMPLLRSSAHARFWAFGSLTSMAPICAAMPSNRLLQTSAVGGLALMALAVSGVHSKAAWMPAGKLRRRAIAIVAAWFLVANLLISPCVYLTSLMSIGVLGGVEDHLLHALPADTTEQTRVVVVNTPLDVVGIMPPIALSANAKPIPRRWLCLHAGSGDVVIEPLDAHRLRVSSEDHFVNRPCSQLFRDPVTHPFRAGEVIALPGGTATVEQLGADGCPLNMIFTFDVPLTDPSIHWLALQDGEYTPLTLPAVGATASFRGLDLQTTAGLVKRGLAFAFGKHAAP